MNVPAKDSASATFASIALFVFFPLLANATDVSLTPANGKVILTATALNGYSVEIPVQ